VGRGESEGPCAPVSQICTFILLSSTVIVRVPNSTPIVDLLSILNPLRMKRESTVASRYERVAAASQHLQYVRFLI
jgi:hypothetical protein